MSIKVAVVGDTHADEHSRFDEHNRIMKWIGEDFAKRGIDLWAHGGDAWERKSTSKERAANGTWVRQWAKVAPGIIVKGNHDDELDIEWLGKLSTVHPVYAMTSPGIVQVAGLSIPCLPWPRAERLLAALPDASVSEVDDAAKAALRAILAGLGDEVKALGKPSLFLSHAMARGAKTSLGQPLIGCSMELGLDDLALVGADAYALAHIHMPQEWSINGAPVHYPGSPRRTAYGETEDKGYLIYEFHDDGRVTTEFVKTPAAPMYLLETSFTSEGFGGDSTVPKAFCMGAEIRFRYRVESALRDEAKAAAKARAKAWEDYGAADVKIEEVVIPTSKARVPEVALAKGLPEKLAVYWASKGVDHGDRKNAILAKLAQLEEKHRAA